MKVVLEGYNGTGMNYDGGNRRDVNGKANAGLTLGINGRSTNKNDREEKILTMLMSGGYNDDGYHFDEYEAKEVVEQMYHVKGSLFYLSKF